MGASVVNALSEEMSVEVHKNGGKYAQHYARGKKVAAVKKVGSTDHHGTVTIFKPDVQIFNEIVLDRNRIITHMRQQAYLIKGLKITVLDAREYEGKIDMDMVYLRIYDSMCLR